MRNQWYGDHRDVVKWGALVRLAREYRLRTVLQVAYFRRDRDVPLITSESGTTQVAPEVLRHFRDIRHVDGLAASTGIEIVVYDRPFEVRSRNDYTAAVITKVRELAGRSSAIFLDPDTGLSDNHRSPAHVTPAEVTAIWSTLGARDWLVLYQHAFRDADWAAKRRATFEACCPGGRILQFLSPNGARDVALFAASPARAGEPAPL